MKRIVRSCALAAVVAAVAVAWAVSLATRDRSYPALATTVIVPSGATGRDVARLLARAGVIGSPLVFDALARATRERDAMKAGEYRIAPHRTQAEILAQLVTGGEQLAVWVTIPEGFTNAEIARTFAARGFGTAATLRAAFDRGGPSANGVRIAPGEGDLFPDTYLVPRTATPAAIATMMVDEFRRHLPADAARRASRFGLTVPQVVTVASLVEREAKADGERALMAGVYYNRLRLGMPLQVDATLEYAFPHHKTVISNADLRMDSAYNSYEHVGLPPTPIANPGAASLRAAFAPERSTYLYYVYAGNGHHAFSRTLAEHDANVARFLR